MEVKALKDIGLTESEIKVYFALLELEVSTTGPIVKRSKVPDSKIYYILDKLKNKGLASFVIKNNVKHFRAANPKNLIRILEEKQNKIEDQKKELLENIIPQIDARRKMTEEKQEATVYESLGGLRSAFSSILDSLKPGEEYQAFITGESMDDDKAISLLRNHHKRRMAKGIRARIVADRSHKKIVDSFYRHRGVGIRYTEHKLPVGTFIFNDHVMKVIWGERQTAFVIKSRKNYQYYKNFFDDVWKNAKV